MSEGCYCNNDWAKKVILGVDVVFQITELYVLSSCFNDTVTIFFSNQKSLLNFLNEHHMLPILQPSIVGNVRLH